MTGTCSVCKSDGLEVEKQDCGHLACESCCYVVLETGNRTQRLCDECVPKERSTIWRVHAEKIAEDVAERLLADFVIYSQVTIKQTVKDKMIEMIVLEISKTLDMTEDE